MRKLALMGAVVGLWANNPAQAADLLTAYFRAETSDPQYLAAQAAHDAAIEALPQARSAFLPKLNVSASSSHTESDVKQSMVPSTVGTTRKYDANTWSLKLSQPLFHYDAFAQYGQAGSRVMQADTELAAANQALMVRVAEAYFERLSAQDNLQLAQAEKTAIEQQLRQTKQRFDVGLTAVTDVHEAQARFDLAVSQVIAAENQRAVAQERLAEITGEAYPALSPLGEVPLATPEPVDVESWVKQALEQNLQLLAAQAGAESARREIDRRRAARYPTLDLNASYGHSEMPAFESKTDDKVIALQLNWALYQGGAISSRTREAERLFAQAGATLERQRRATVRQTRDSYLGVQTSISQVQALKQALASARTALQATEAGFQVGTRTTVDVLDAQRQMYLARRNYASARYAYVLSILRLKQATGTVSVQDLQQVNAWLQVTPAGS